MIHVHGILDYPCPLQVGSGPGLSVGDGHQTASRLDLPVELRLPGTDCPVHRVQHRQPQRSRGQCRQNHPSSVIVDDPRLRIGGQPAQHPRGVGQVIPALVPAIEMAGIVARGKSDCLLQAGFRDAEDLDLQPSTTQFSGQEIDDELDSPVADRWHWVPGWRDQGHLRRGRTHRAQGPRSVSN